MSETVDLKLYSPLQVDIIDRDAPGHPFPLQAVGREHKREYQEQVMDVLRGLQSQEDARHAFTASELDWSEICDKILSVTRTVEPVSGRLYGVFTCRSSGALEPEEIDDLKRQCQELWEHGWGEGYAHCPGEDPSLGLFIHFWQDDSAPLLLRRELETAQIAEWGKAVITKITPNTFWRLLAQAKGVYGQDQKAVAYWLTERLLSMGPEQALNFHSITHGYMELADKYGLWNAAILMREDGCYSDGFEDFRAWLIFQGKDTYLAALKDPDSLADVPAGEDCRFEALLYVGDMAHERLTGRHAYDAVSPDIQQRLLADLRQDIVYGAEVGYPHEWSEVAAYLPRLTAQHLTPEELQACICRGHMWNHDDLAIKRARAAPKKEKARSVKMKGGESR